MTEVQVDIDVSLDQKIDAVRGKGWFAIGGMVGAILASSCCILPLVLVTLGISGAWIGNLTALEAFKPWFAGAALASIGFGFWQVYVRPKAVCAKGSFCARPASSIVIKIALWFATTLVALAMTIDWWAPFFY